MDTCDGQLHPLGDVGGMIADTLEILGDHDQVDALLSSVALRDQIDDAAADVVKEPVDIEES